MEGEEISLNKTFCQWMKFCALYTFVSLAAPSHPVLARSLGPTGGSQANCSLVQNSQTSLTATEKSKQVAEVKSVIKKMH